MNYRINKEAIIFLGWDRAANYHTIAYDWESGDLYAIRPLEYQVLWFIYKNEPVSNLTLIGNQSKDLSEARLKSILKIMVDKKIVLTDEQ